MDFSALGMAAAESEDLTKASEGFKRELPRAGIAMMRLVDYIETGKHEPTNPTFKAAYKCILTFELSHPDHMIEINGEKVPQRISVRVNKSHSDRGKYRPLFKIMNKAHGEKYKHFVQMIGLPFLGEISHSEPDPKGTVYANVEVNQIKAPYTIDVLSGAKTEVPVPELSGTPKVFMWEAAVSDEQYLAMWESIFIEGTRQDQNGKEISKNYIQETVMANTEWEGSRLQGLVATDEQISIADDLGIPTL